MEAVKTKHNSRTKGSGDNSRNPLFLDVHGGTVVAAVQVAAGHDYWYELWDFWSDGRDRNTATPTFRHNEFLSDVMGKVEWIDSAKTPEAWKFAIPK